MLAKRRGGSDRNDGLVSAAQVQAELQAAEQLGQNPSVARRTALDRFLEKLLMGFTTFKVGEKLRCQSRFKVIAKFSCL